MLTATEYSMREPVPLHRVHEVILGFCRGRDDVVVFGAQAVNLHTATPRMTQDVDLLCPHPAELARELARHLSATLRIAARVREVRRGVGFCVYQVRKSDRRPLADVRLLDFEMPAVVVRRGVRYTSAPLTLAMKILAYAKRRASPKGATDLADVRRLLLAHGELRAVDGLVADALRRLGAGEAALAAWRELAQAPIVSDEDADEGY
jgi:hypothetical protein